MKRLIAGLALFAVSAAPALAAHWTVDAAKSQLGFSVAWSGEPFTGTFKSWKADIEFDPNDLAHSRVVATIDTGSETTPSPEGDDGLKSALGFAVDKFPTATFEAASFKRLADGSYLAGGKLTLRGVTRSVALPFKLDLQGNRVHMTGKTTVIRTDFGVGQGEWASPTPVAHEVTVTIDLTATRG